MAIDILDLDRPMSYPSPGSTPPVPPGSGNETTMALYQAMRATPDHLPKERQKWKDAIGSKWRLHLGGLSCPYAPHMVFLRYSPKSNMARYG